MIVARLLDRSEVAHVLAASLEREVALVPLEEPPEPGQQRIELRAPGLEAPFLLLAQQSGEPVGNMYPLRLEPLDGRQEAVLRAFVDRESTSRALVLADEPPALAVVGEFEGLGRLDAPPARRREHASTDPEVAPPTKPVDSSPPRPASVPPPAPPDAGPPDLVFRPPSLKDAAAAPSVGRRKSSSGALVLPVPPRPAVERADDRPSGPPPSSSSSVPPPPPHVSLAPTPMVPKPRAPTPRPPAPTPPPGRERRPARVAEPPADSGAGHGLKLPTADRLVGRTIAGGKYEIQDILGEGGTGTVYKARHIALDKTIAIKVLHAMFQGDAQFAKRFHREALAASKLDHPNVMRVLDFGQEADGLLYLVMEYLAGRDLQQIIEAEGALPTIRTVEIMSQVCAALSVAHDAGIVHRDVKPENIVIVKNRDDDGTLVDLVKVLDFGIAKFGETATSVTRSRLTAAGTIWGTPHYMSPEQARAEQADARSDLYACGVILYELATVRVPFDDESPLSIALKHVTEVPEAPSRLNPDIDPHLEIVILKAMHKNPAKRQQSARELRAELRAVLEHALDDKTVRRDVPGQSFLDVATEVSPPPIDVERTMISAASPEIPVFEDERPAAVIVEDIDPSRPVGRMPRDTAKDSEELPPDGRHPTVTPPTSVKVTETSAPRRTGTDADIGDAPTLTPASMTPPTAVRIPAGVVGPPDFPAAAAGAVQQDAGEALDAQSAGFVEFFVALTAAVARTSYYERTHPEFDRALSVLVRTVGAPVRGRGEVSIARRDVSHVPHLFVQSGLGEFFELKKILPVSVFESYGTRMADVFMRRHMVSLTLKEGIEVAEVGDMVELLSGPDIPMDQLRQQFLSRGLRHLSILFAADLIGRERRLPWEVDLCISRLARDLRALPLLRGVDREGMLKLRTQLIGDVIRTLRGPEPVKILLENSDLVSAAVQHVPELAALDLAGPLVTALRPQLCIKIAYLLLADLETALSQAGGGEATGAATTRKLVHVIGSRFVRERAVESDEVLRELHGRAILSFPELPPDLQVWILAEQQAEELIKAPEPILRALDTTFDEARYAREMETLTRTIRVLARRGEALALWAVVARLERHARGAEAGEGSREALAARTLRTIEEAELLGPIADALLSGPVQVRDPARGILVSAAAAGAKALCAARRRSSSEVGRPRFVATLREIGGAAANEIAAALADVDPTGASGEPTLAEDLLRAVPEIAHEDLGRLVVRFVDHKVGAVRRMAAVALAGTWGARARPTLLVALDDVDEGVRVAVLGGLRRIGGIDGSVVERVDEILSGDVVAGDDLCASAAAALFDVGETARPAAVQTLMRALDAKSRGTLSRIVGGGSKSADSPLVVETVGRVLIALAGPDGRALVEKRAERSPEPLRGRLLALLR